ncbi:MAG: hypothetical protein Q9168_007151 [Polycauliona sp. 1 TL-2023]
MSLIYRDSEIVYLTRATDKDTPSEKSAPNSRQVSSQQLLAGLLHSESCQDNLLNCTNGNPSNQRRSITSGRFVIAEDEEDHTPTTQDTSGSVVLVQRNANSQSQERSLDKEEQNSAERRSACSASFRFRSSDHDLPKMSINASPSNHPTSSSDNPPRPSNLLGKLKGIRAEGRASQAPYALDTYMSDAEIPIAANRSPQEAANTAHTTMSNPVQPPQPIRSDAVEISDFGPVPNPAKADGHPIPVQVWNEQQAKQNGIRSYREPEVPQNSPTPRRSSTPKPQAYPTLQPQVRTTPEHQSRFAVRPPAIPVGVPLAVRSSPGGQRTVPGRNHLTRHQESANIPKPTILKPLGFDNNEHIISLAMNFRVRHQYTTIISLYRDAIMQLMESHGPNEQLMNDITKLLTRISGVLQHSDLDAEEARDHSSQPSPEDEARWAEQCSFKFCFLRHFLDEIRPLDVHVSIVAQPGRLLDLIEMFVIGRGILYFRPDGKGSSHPADGRFANCACQVSIVPSGPSGVHFPLKPASLVIAFDASVSAMETQVHRMRVQQEHNWLQPMLRLIVYKSAEHLAVCLPREIEQPDRIRRIISGMTQLRHEAGILQPEDMEVSALAQEVAVALKLGGHQRYWTTLPSVRPLSLEFHDSSRSSSTQEGSQLSQEPEVSFESSTLKRAWDVTDPSLSDRNKRQRVSTVDGNAYAQNMNESQHINNLLKINAELTTEIENLKSQVHFDRLTTLHKALEAQNSPPHKPRTEPTSPTSKPPSPPSKPATNSKTARNKPSTSQTPSSNPPSPPPS